MKAWGWMRMKAWRRMRMKAWGWMWTTTCCHDYARGRGEFPTALFPLSLLSPSQFRQQQNSLHYSDDNNNNNSQCVCHYYSYGRLNLTFQTMICIIPYCFYCFCYYFCVFVTITWIIKEKKTSWFEDDSLKRKYDSRERLKTRSIIGTR